MRFVSGDSNVLLLLDELLAAGLGRAGDMCDFGRVSLDGNEVFEAFLGNSGGTSDRTSGLTSVLMGPDIPVEAPSVSFDEVLCGGGGAFAYDRVACWYDGARSVLEGEASPYLEFESRDFLSGSDFAIFVSLLGLGFILDGALTLINISSHYHRLAN